MTFLASLGDFASVDQYMLDSPPPPSPHQPVTPILILQRRILHPHHLRALLRPISAKRFISTVVQKRPRYLVMLLLM